MRTEQLGVVLLDALPGEDTTFDTSQFERWDHPVEVCAGPDVETRCPILGGEGCPKFDVAHGIIFKLDLDQPEHRAILRQYRALGRADLPIRVLCTEEQARGYTDELRDVEVWTHEPTTADLDGFASEVEAVDRFA